MYPLLFPKKMNLTYVEGDLDDPEVLVQTLEVDANLQQVVLLRM